MTAAEIAWLTGLFDGEGCIGRRVQINKNVWGVKIQVTNTCKPLLERISEITGVGYITTRYHDNPNHKPTHDWHTTGRNAKLLIALMEPWLIAKKEQAQSVLADEESIAVAYAAKPSSRI